MKNKNKKKEELKPKVAELQETEFHHNQVKKMLRESEEEYRTILETTGTAMTLVEENMVISKVNKEFERLCGYCREEIEGKKNWTEFVVKEDLKKMKEYHRLRRINPSLAPRMYEFRFIDRKGNIKDILITIDMVPGTKKSVASLLDITELKRTQEMLRESEEKYRTVVENASEAIVVAQDGVTKFANPRAIEISGYSEKELSQSSFLEFIHPEEREIIRKEHFEVLRGKRAHRILSFRIMDRKGNIRWVEANTARITWQGKPANLTFLTDITQCKKAEKELKESLERLQKLLGGVIRAMALTIEKRDPYTAGHQQRVSNLARTIATQMKLSRDQIEKVRTAAIIHDIGKIAIPTEILHKPTRLTDLEFSLVKSHPEIAYEIIKEIEFPYPIAEIVLQHHERMDGSGYPAELKGENILLEARILAVADVVEAMSSHRPYRPALGIDRALEEIEKNKGKLYDPEVVDVCIRLFKEKGFKF